MATSRVSVYLDEAAIGRMTLPGGMIHAYVQHLTFEVLEIAWATAPVLTGRMRSSLSRGGGSYNQYGCSERVFVGVDYAKYVLKGTAGPIRSPLGRPMAVGASQGGMFGVSWRMQVDGQAANNFLGAALTRVMRAHGL